MLQINVLLHSVEEIIDVCIVGWEDNFVLPSGHCWGMLHSCLSIEGLQRQIFQAGRGICFSKFSISCLRFSTCKRKDLSNAAIFGILHPSYGLVSPLWPTVSFTNWAMQCLKRAFLWDDQNGMEDLIIILAHAGL
nr:hypothetical protein Iba_chr11aCG16770 [Ipomoea batatas]